MEKPIEKRSSEEKHKESRFKKYVSNCSPRSARSLLAFWILGLCNNYGYVVMLSAAHDILSQLDNNKNAALSGDHENSTNETLTEPSTVRQCNTVSTGAILLADIVPSLFIKVIAPFFPLAIHIRMVITIFLSACGYIMVATAKTQWIAIFGVVCTAMSSGLGEVSILSYMSLYKTKNVISMWSSGTGGAGFFGSFTYAGLTTVLGLTPAVTMYILLCVPTMMGISFWFILERPKTKLDEGNASPVEDVISFESSEVEVEIPTATKESFITKIKAIPALATYMIPLGLVYLFEYFINQGLFELLQFDLTWLSNSAQYKWYQVIYQIGVFISRSSINLVEINHTWIFAMFQGINVIIFFCEAIYLYIPYIYIVFVLILWEGFLGGGTYVNTYNRINNEVPEQKREFSMAITSLADAVGISIAGFVSLPAHNYVCGLAVHH